MNQIQMIKSPPHFSLTFREHPKLQGNDTNALTVTPKTKQVSPFQLRSPLKRSHTVITEAAWADSTSRAAVLKCGSVTATVSHHHSSVPCQYIEKRS